MKKQEETKRAKVAAMNAPNTTPSRAPPGTPLADMTSVQLNTHAYDFKVAQIEASKERAARFQENADKHDANLKENADKLYANLKENADKLEANLKENADNLEANLKKELAYQKQIGDGILAMIQDRRNELDGGEF